MITHLPRGRLRSGARRAIIGATAVTVAALVVSACGSNGQTSGQSEPSASSSSAPASSPGNNSGDKTAAGGQLVIGVDAQVMSLDPGLVPSGGRETIAVRNLIFDTLVVQGNDLKPAPRLAESWSTPSPNTWVFKLHSGVTFTNGEAFNAKVAKYNIDRELDPSLKLYYYSQLSALVEKAEAPDDDTLKITTKGPAPGLLTILAYMQMVPEAYMKKVGDEAFNKAPIGTGPFKFDKREQDKVYLVRNDDYWGGAPKLDGVVFQTIPEVSARIAALKSGAIQVSGGIPADMADSLTGTVKSVSVPGTRIFFLGMNVTKAPFDDVAVRRAVAAAINRESIVTNLYGGKAQALNQYAFPAMLGFQKDIDGYAYDLDAAKKALSKVTAPVVIDSTQADSTLAQAVLGQLQEAGLKASVRTVEDSAFASETQSGTEQAYLSSWGVAEGDLDALVIRHFASNRTDTSKFTNYSSPKMDDLIKQEQSTVDRDRRQELFKPLMQSLIDDSPWAPILTPDEIYGVSTGVSGWEPSPIGLFWLNDTTVSGS